MKTKKLLLITLLMCVLCACGGTQESNSSQEVSSSINEDTSSEIISSEPKSSHSDESSEISSQDASSEISSIIESSEESSETSSFVESSEESSETSSSEEKEVIDTDFDGLPDDIDNDPQVNIKNAEVYTDDSNGFVLDGNVTFSVDYRRFVNDSNKEFNKSLAQLGLILSNDLMDFTSTKIADAVHPSESVLDRKSIYDEFGCEDFEYYQQCSDLTIDQDNNDINNYAFAHHVFKYNQQKYDVAFLVLEATDSSDNRQWFSNLDAGCDSDEYYGYTGSHPLWTDLNDHKGFAITSRRIMSSFNKYIDNHVDKNNCILFITGYSRGGALANLIGTYYEKETSYKSFTYAFASPTTTASSETECAKVKTVFNVINEDDVVGHIPFSCWGFRRYGTDLIASVNEHKEAFDLQFGGSYSCLPTTIYEGLGEVFGTTRESIYIADQEAILDENATEKEAQDYLESDIKPMLDGLGVEDAYTFEIKYDAQKQVYLTCGYYSPYTLVEGIKTIAFSDTEFELDFATILKLTFLIPTYISFALPIISPILNDPNAVVYGHMPLGYWMLIQE